MKLWHTTAFLLAALALTACTTNFAFTRTVSYKNSAEANYQKGINEMKDEGFPEALKYFVYVKNKFPFSRYATLAELRIGDTYFAMEKYLDAIDAYKQFQKFHPTHPEVVNGYAAYRICKGYIRQIPSDWFFVPPSHEKDQSATHDALRELKYFLKTYPKSKHREKAEKLYQQCLKGIADHELYVARFYLERDKPQATILRLETVVERYPDAGMTAEVMLMLGKTYLKLKQQDKAKETFSLMVSKHPDSPYSAKAKLYLQHMTTSTK